MYFNREVKVCPVHVVMMDLKDKRYVNINFDNYLKLLK